MAVTTKYCNNETMNIDEFYLYGIFIGNRYDIRILQRHLYTR